MKFFAILAAAILVSSASAKEFFIYFGTFTNAMSQGIYVARLDADTGKISEPELAAETYSPCWIAVAPDQKHMYAANSVKTFNGEAAGEISAFALDANSGHLNFLNAKSSGSAGPCCTSTDADGRFLFAANYAGGSVKSFRVNADGSIGADASVVLHHGSGPNTNRQASAHPHFICVDPSNKFALACDLGTDKVVIYKFGPDGALVEHATASVPPGAGARHLAFSRDGKTAYVVNEMGCSISRFKWDAERGELKLQDTVSALPPDVTVQPGYTAAEIMVSPDGRFLYTTIRGHDSVSVFEIGKHGALKFVQNVSSGGNVPRGLGLDPTGRWLFTGHQKSNNAVEFAVDEKTGEISPTGRELKIGSPVDVKFVEIR
ncbi:MAG TPA: lactonase family protein [Candidatus Sulfotelmatobacter sp.]|jgi:6-phosphogluconolactonase|nr:lactonase family protein [Candidatus Sulfotelmatobacter sp.]